MCPQALEHWPEANGGEQQWVAPRACCCYVPLLAPTHKGGGGGFQALAPTSGVAQSSGVVAAPLQRTVWLAALAGAAGAFGLPQGASSSTTEKCRWWRPTDRRETRAKNSDLKGRESFRSYFLFWKGSIEDRKTNASIAIASTQRIRTLIFARNLT